MYKYPLHKIIHLPHYRTDGFTALFLNSSLRNFGISLVGIFIPLYVYEQFMVIPATFVQSLSAVVWFFILHAATVLLMIFPASLFIYRVGFRWSVFVSSIFMLVHLAALFLAEGNLVFLWLAALAGGMLVPFYWLAYHGIFVEDGKRQEVGQEVGIFGVAARLAGAFGPLIGGLIIAFLGFHVLFALSFAVIFLSAIPLFLIPHHKHHLVVYPKRVWERLLAPGAFRVAVAFSSRGAEEMIQAIFWPLYIFLVVGSYEVLGGITTAGLFVSVVTVVWVGRLFDKRRKATMFHLGATGVAVIWLARGLMRTAPQILSIEVIEKFIGAFYWLPFDAYTYLLAGREDISRFFVFREIIIFSSRILILLFIWAMALLGFSFLPIFIFASLVTLISNIIVGARPVHEAR